jgi:hypothetical protein
MKKLLALLILVFTLSVFAFNDAFCEGWATGYKAGWCYRQNFCLAPLVPLCPLPNLGEDNYMGGYNRGFLVGLNARQEQDGN